MRFIILLVIFFFNCEFSTAVGGIAEMKALTGDAPYLGSGNQVNLKKSIFLTYKLFLGTSS